MSVFRLPAQDSALLSIQLISFLTFCLSNLNLWYLISDLIFSELYILFKSLLSFIFLLTHICSIALSFLIFSCSLLILFSSYPFLFSSSLLFSSLLLFSSHSRLFSFLFLSAPLLLCVLCVRRQGPRSVCCPPPYLVKSQHSPSRNRLGRERET